jgi:putative phosphoesterase
MRARARAAPVVQTAAVTLPTRADGSVRLGVVADTHSRPHPATVDLLRALSPDAILHAGDIGDLDVLETLAAVAPVHAVRGNIDVRAPNLPDELTIDLVHDGAQVLRILLVHIAVNGPRLRADVARSARAAGARLVVCGHSHVPFIGEDRGLIVFNPGSVGPRRFSLPIVFGVLARGERGLRLEHVSCETGAPWLPP